MKIMNAALAENPQSYPILHAQCDFLMSKGKHEWAQAVAQQAVNSAPSEFVTWAKLTETYIELGQFDSALLTLNSCPMFTFNERDLHRMPTPAKTHLPVKKFIADSGILDEESARDNEVGRAYIAILTAGRRRAAAPTGSRIARDVCQGVRAAHAAGVEDWMGRPAQDSVGRVCHGGGVPPAQDDAVGRCERARRQCVGGGRTIAK